MIWKDNLLSQHIVHLPPSPTHSFSLCLSLSVILSLHFSLSLTHSLTHSLTPEYVFPFPDLSLQILLSFTSLRYTPKNIRLRFSSLQCSFEIHLHQCRLKTLGWDWLARCQLSFSRWTAKHRLAWHHSDSKPKGLGTVCSHFFLTSREVKCALICSNVSPQAFKKKYYVGAVQKEIDLSTSGRHQTAGASIVSRTISLHHDADYKPSPHWSQRLLAFLLGWFVEQPTNLPTMLFDKMSTWWSPLSSRS